MIVTLSEFFNRTLHGGYTLLQFKVRVYETFDAKIILRSSQVYLAKVNLRSKNNINRCF